MANVAAKLAELLTPSFIAHTGSPGYALPYGTPTGVGATASPWRMRQGFRAHAHRLPPAETRRLLRTARLSFSQLIEHLKNRLAVQRWMSPFDPL